MLRGNGHVVLASVMGGIQIEVAVEHVTQGIAGRGNEAYRCLKILSWSYSMAESSPI